MCFISQYNTFLIRKNNPKDKYADYCIQCSLDTELWFRRIYSIPSFSTGTLPSNSNGVISHATARERALQPDDKVTCASDLPAINLQPHIIQPLSYSLYHTASLTLPLSSSLYNTSSVISSLSINPTGNTPTITSLKHPLETTSLLF